MSASHHIVVVRHGKAEKSAQGSDQRDYDRHLTERGRADSGAAGAIAGSALGEPTGRVVALVSSAARAVETWQEVAASLPDVVEVDVRDDLYQAGVDDLLALMAATAEDVTAVLVVGHDPTMSQTVSTLAGGECELRTAAVAVLSCDGSWAAIGPDTCRLDSLDVGRAGG
ncbi:MAG: histidine phosphatase family protein [Nocardioidaceae bacterium]|nr:histidine phosphatase family protein [Nocardioidaceae bacterium]